MLLRRPGLRFIAVWLLGSTLAALGLTASCGDGESASTKNKPDSGSYPVPGPGEQCEWPPEPAFVSMAFQPTFAVFAPGQTREFSIVVEPDMCLPTPISFETGDKSVVAAPASLTLDLLTPTVEIKLTGKAAGTTKLTASIPRGDGTTATQDLEVVVQSPEIAACSGSGGGKVTAGGTLKGSGGLAAASIGLQANGVSNPVSDLWHVDPFDATIACGANQDDIPAGFTKVGPAVTFGPAGTVFKREIPFSIPINPAAIPDAATLRHVTVSYSGPAAQKARAIPIADPRIVKTDTGYALDFMAPWLGTYQAVAKTDGGKVTKTRHLTHRAIIGISMGGGGTAMFGLRNHDKFDVIAPLGGPVDWTWMLGHIERNHLGGFAPSDGTTAPAYQPNQFPSVPLPYEHPSTFNQWWYEYPKTGNGGSFPRSEYVQIFRDLALMFGNPGSYNPLPDAENLPAGISPTDKTVVGDHPGRECAVWVDPVSTDPAQHAKEDELSNDCPKERCKYTATLQNYYDDEYNPNGTFPVITVCDGAPQDQTKSPWANTWAPVDASDNVPLELALAVDYNGNGVRDQDEPIIKSGYEPFDDVGLDGKADKDEPGYDPVTNPDPDGDDYHPQYNPLGTEGNYRCDAEGGKTCIDATTEKHEPWRDYGLDGVDGTKSKNPNDFGEGNGKFDVSLGYKTFLERDSRTVIDQLAIGSQSKKLDDDALSRVDLWTDGGTRDLFNFSVDASALAGAWFSRGRIVHYYTESQNIPGQDVTNPSAFDASRIDWSAIPGGVLLRYGKIDPQAKDIQSGSGQHVGTPDEIARRLQSALYFIGSRWPDAPRTYVESANIDPGIDPLHPDSQACEVNGACDFSFTDSRGRTGPVSVNLPPGYLHAKRMDVRYPVIYLLHGYGQTPEDLKAAIVFLQNWMNFGGDSSATRLPKAIMVYVDGRCRPGADEAECIRGTFFTDSVRQHGPKMEGWFLELMGWVDKNFRTMPASDIPWTE